MAKEPAAAGFTVKSGWACAVLLAGSRRAPRLADCRRVEISDPGIPDAKQPYHAGFGTARDAGDELQRLVASVRSYGKKSIGALLAEYQAGRTLHGAGVVVGSLIDPVTIGNDHIRIHAMEGQLFRTVVIEAAGSIGLKCRVLRQRDLYSEAAKHLNKTDAAIRTVLDGMRKDTKSGWRTDHKAAALSAWMLLK